LSLGLNGDYLDTRFIKISTSDGPYNVGDPLDLVPKYQYTVSAQRDFNWNGKSGFARMDYNEQGHQTFRFRTFGPVYFGESDIVHMLNFRVGMRWNESLSVSLFAQNLLNDRGISDPFGFLGTGARSAPLTVGINFGVKL
jgi:iron complex outermembrane receptor protein